jgi:hypothetical protein
MFTDGIGFESGCEGLLEKPDSSTPPATQIRTSSAKGVDQIDQIDLNDVATGTFDGQYTFTLTELMPKVKYARATSHKHGPSIYAAHYIVCIGKLAPSTFPAGMGRGVAVQAVEVPGRWRLVGVS